MCCAWRRASCTCSHRQDHLTKFIHVAFFDAAAKFNEAAFLQKAVAAFPYKIHNVLPDTGMAFAEQHRYREGSTDSREGGHIFEHVCRKLGIEHHLTKPHHPWAHEQVERVNRTVKPATRRAFHYPDFVARKGPCAGVRHAAFDFAKHWKALRWRAPLQFTCDA